MKEKIKIVSWNVNGIRAIVKKDKLNPIITQLNPDILCLQETKSDKKQANLNMPEYIQYFNTAQKAGYSGTAIFTKYSPSNVNYNLPIKFAEKHKIQHDGFGDPNKEGRVITLEFDSFFLVNVYTPNAKPNLERLELRHKVWDPAFLDYMKWLDSQKPVIVCGDFNVAHKKIDLARPEENEGHTGFTKEEREGIDNIIKAGFIDSFRKFNTKTGHYTWWSYRSFAREKNIGWRIDYIFVSEKLEKNLIDAKIHNEFYGSDHCPVSIDIKIK